MAAPAKLTVLNAFMSRGSRGVMLVETALAVRTPRRDKQGKQMSRFCLVTVAMSFLDFLEPKFQE